MCEYCKISKDFWVTGKLIRSYEFKKTAGYKEPRNSNDVLEIFILKGNRDKKAGLMINSGCGFRYIDICYCPMCGRKLEEQ